MSRLPLVAGLVALLAGCAGQGDRTATQTPTGKTAAPAPARVVTTTIAAISERNGEVLAELPLGSADQVEAGTLMRVYTGSGDQRLLKGMLQVTEVLGDHHSIARSIGLTDRADPLRPGDTVRLTDLAANLTDYQAQVKEDTAQRQASTKADDDAFTKLREQYQVELAAAQARLDQQLAAEQASHDRVVADLASRQQRELQVRDAEHQADRTALAAAMRKQSDEAIAADRKEREQKLRELQAENQRLGAHAERVVLELQRCQTALSKAQADQATSDANYAKALRAELETRQVLQSRLADLEQRLTGKTSTAVTVLSNDPARGETVLAQLERLTADLAAVQAERERLAKALTEASTANTAAQQALADAKAEAAPLADARHAAEQAGEALKKAEADAAEARRDAAAHERGRLDAERQLYDLAARVLALDAKPESLSELQQRLQQLVAATNGDAP